MLLLSSSEMIVLIIDQLCTGMCPDCVLVRCCCNFISVEQMVLSTYSKLLFEFILIWDFFADDVIRIIQDQKLLVNLRQPSLAAIKVVCNTEVVYNVYIYVVMFFLIITLQKNHSHN